jgi:hypothetical protein
MVLRFTIRDMLWLTVVAAICVAWWVDHQYSIQKWSKVHYSIEGTPGGIPKVRFSPGDTVGGAHLFQGTVEFPAEWVALHRRLGATHPRTGKTVLRAIRQLREAGGRFYNKMLRFYWAEFGVHATPQPL